MIAGASGSKNPPTGKSTNRYSGKFMPACGRQAAEEGLETGVVSYGVPDRQGFEREQKGITLIIGLLQPFKCHLV